MLSTTNTKWNNYDGFYSVVTPQKRSDRTAIVIEQQRYTEEDGMNPLSLGDVAINEL